MDPRDVIKIGRSQTTTKLRETLTDSLGEWGWGWRCGGVVSGGENEITII